MNVYEFFRVMSDEVPSYGAVLLTASIFALVGWAFAPWLIRGAVANGLEKIRKTLEEKK